MAFKHGLGKGLNALLPVDDDIPPKNAFSPKNEVSKSEKENLNGEILIPLKNLKANPNQPRKSFDDESLKELANSIKEHGIIQPILVESSENETFTIVAGERRFRAANLAGLTEVPVIIRTYDEEKRMEVSLIENIQRTDLNPIEEALAYKKLMEITGLLQDEVAEKVGKKRSTVTNTLRLLNLPKTMQEALIDGSLSSGHARALLSVTDSDYQEKLFQKIINSDVSVREAEKLASETKQIQRPKLDLPKRDANLNAMEEKFIEFLGTKVTIDGDFNKGSIHINYYSMADLDRLYELLSRPRD